MPFDVGEMYRKWTLDCIIDIAKEISSDFVERYLQYSDVATAEELANLKSRVGHDPDWPDQAQRKAIYGAFLGPSDGKQPQKDLSRFHDASGSVRDAAVKYAERVFDTGEEALRRAFLDTVSGLQAHLNTVEGAAVERGERQARNIFDASVSILRDKAISRAFGLPGPGNGEWPLENRNYDGRGAYLIEEVTRVLVPQGTGQITRSRFVVMQRVANRGLECIRGVTDYKDSWTDAEQKELIVKAYSWATALKDLSKTDIIPGASRTPSR